MGRKNFNAFLKRQRAERKKKKKEEKREQKREERNQNQDTNLDDMIAYVDEDGNILSEPPEEQEEVKSDDILNEGEEESKK